MGRWALDGQERLQRAALALFSERGYATVTVAEIASAAGLTTRSFFNHFSDKREVLFAGAAALELEVINLLRDTNVEILPLEAAMTALTVVGSELKDVMQYAELRRALITSSQDLQERELSKNAALAGVIAAELARWNISARVAALAAQAAVTVFVAAFDAWSMEPSVAFPTLVQTVREDYFTAIYGSITMD